MHREQAKELLEYILGDERLLDKLGDALTGRAKTKGGSKPKPLPDAILSKGGVNAPPETSPPPPPRPHKPKG